MKQGSYITLSQGFYFVSNIWVNFVFQYSEKEDKYEEEIKVLTDKLKEVRWPFLPLLTGQPNIKTKHDDTEQRCTNVATD